MLMNVNNQNYDDKSKNDDYFFSEERQINIVQKIIVHIKNSLNNLEDLEIAVNYLSQAINLLDELFGKNQTRFEFSRCVWASVSLMRYANTSWICIKNLDLLENAHDAHLV